MRFATRGRRRDPGGGRRSAALVVATTSGFLLCTAALWRGSHVQTLRLPSTLATCTADVRAERERLPVAAATSAVASLVLVSTYPPTHCGLATFSADLRAGLLASGRVAAVDVVALHTGAPGTPTPQYPPEVVHVVRKHVATDYTDAAAVINAKAYSAVLLQHEFGIFGGVHGEFVLELLRPLRRPVMSTLHTVEAHASQVRLAVATQVMLWSTAAVTLAGDGCRAVGSWAHAYGAERVNSTTCEHITHGVPVPSACPGEWHRTALGLPSEAFIILTGGLISRGKGIEHVIAAMPAVLAANPHARLLIVGSPHPSDTKSIAYAAQLRADVAASPAKRAITFVSGGYLTKGALQRLYAAAHVFAAPHTSRSQRSSGTLAAACAAGAAGVATRFPAAVDLIEGPHAGIVVQHDDPSAVASALAALAADPERTRAMGARCAAAMRTAHWPQVGIRYAELSTRAASKAAGATNAQDTRLDDGATAWLPTCTVSQAPLRSSATNGLMVVSGIRNPGWVDGVGPGWSHLDTWVGRRRRGWGADAVLLKGTMLSWTEPPAEAVPRNARRQRGTAHSVRLFEGPDCTMSATTDTATGGAVLVQTCTGAGWSANRTLFVAPHTARVMCTIHVVLHSNGLHYDSGVEAASPRLSVCVDQLTAAVGDPAYFRWRLRREDASLMRAHKRRRRRKRRRADEDEGSVLDVPLSPDFSLHLDSTDSRGCATQLALSVLQSTGDAPVAAELRLDGKKQPHAVVYHFELQKRGDATGVATGGGSDTAAGVLSAHAELQMRWTAAQKDDAAELCIPALDEAEHSAS